jgi:phage protein D
MNKTPVKIVRIRNAMGKVMEIPSEDLLSIHTSQSIMRYAGTFEIKIINEKGKNSKIAEEGDEVEITLGYKETGTRKVMGGYIDRIIIEKDEESGETLRLEGRDYYSILLDTRISGKIDFKNGYSQIIKEILKSTPFNPDGVLDSQGSGTIILKNAPLIDVIRQIAEEIGWTFKVDEEKVFHFKPITPPKNSGITLTDKDLKSFRFVKERK